MKVQILAILSLTVSATAVGPQNSSPWTPPNEPVYVVAPNYTTEGSGPNETKFGDLLLVQIFPNVSAPSDRLYKKGVLIGLYLDGERRGDVRIEAVKEHQCNSAAALVVPSLADVSKKIIGLATNSNGIRSRAGSRRKPTPSESTSAVQLATREFLRNKVATPLMTRINIQSLVAIEVDDSKEATIVGSFFIQTKTERHDVFLIGKGYSQYGETSDLADFKDHKSIRFIDHLDLNRDRTDEIVLAVGGYESEGYEIVSRQNGKWLIVATGGESGC